MLVRLMNRLHPLRGLPVWARYSLTALIVLGCLGVRHALGTIEDPHRLPLFMIFVPSVILASFFFDRGSGFLAVALSALLGVYFFVAREDPAALWTLGESVRVAAFIFTGVLTAAIIEALRKAVEELNRTLEALGTAEDTSRRNLSLLTEIMEGTPDPIFVKDRNSRYIHMNEATARVFGTTKERIAGRTDAELAGGEDSDRILATDRDVLSSGRTLVLEEQHRSADGILRTYLTTKSPWLGPNREVIGLIGVARDIHDRKLMEERLKTTNAQKQLLLDDINHRVKNHLQTVVGLLYASKQKAADDQSREALEGAIAQLQVIARVYDRLQLHEAATIVDANDFLQTLTADLRATLLGHSQIVVRCHAERHPLQSSHAVLLGLALNELITNAVKYAFTDSRHGEIDIYFSTRGEIACLEVVDNGIGMRANRDGGRGKRLVSSFARELGGTAEWTSDANGTRAALSLPLG
jgi:PAS domain S-box-containing protein